MKTRTVPEIIDAFGGQAAFGRVIGKGASTASEMKRRCTIPPRYWKKIVSAQTVEGEPRVTYEELVDAHSEQEAAA